MFKRYVMIVLSLVLLTMCSSKPTDEETETKAEAKTQQKAEPVPKVALKKPQANRDWAKEMDELVEKAAGLSALANTKQCAGSHDAMVEYLKTHQKRLEQLAASFMKMKFTVPPEDKAAFEKKKAAGYDKQMGETIEKMAGFAVDCCNKELKHEDAFGLEERLDFIRTLQSEPE